MDDTLEGQVAANFVDTSASLQADTGYQVGDAVEYFSASNGGWVRASILALEPGGTYKLNVRAGVAADKIRRIPGSKVPAGSDGGGSVAGCSSSNLSAFGPGDAVEYFSASIGKWIAAKVIAKTPQGTYDLDVKKDVPAQRVRAAASDSRELSSMARSQPSSVPEDRELSEPLSAGLHGEDTPAFGKTVVPSKRVQQHGPLSSSVGSTMFEPAPRSSVGKQYATRGVVPGMGKLPSSTSSSLSLDAPLQLVKVSKQGNKWHYEVCPEAARLLQSQGCRQIAVCSICGLYRTGKSYILNLLLERVQKGLSLFQVGNTTQACTEGLWLWGSVGAGADDGPLLAFVDCEGFGSTDSDRTRDAQLMTLCSLLSSVLVLNTRGALNEGLFNALALTCRFAEHVEERGNEASRPMLLWLLRDFQLDLLDPNGNPITPSEYLEQALHAAPLVGHDQDRGNAAREVRQSLLRFFSQRRCVTLVRPVVEEEQLQRLPTLPYTALRQDFRAGVEALRAQLVATCNACPKTVGAQSLGCGAFVGLLHQFVNGMNENQILSVKGAWETVQHAACGDLSDELRARACAVLRSLSKGQKLDTGEQLPLADEPFRALLQYLRSGIAAEWADRAVGDEIVRGDYWQDLSEAMAFEEETARQQNLRLADDQLNELSRQWLSWLEAGATDWQGHGSQLLEQITSFMKRCPAGAVCRASATLLDATGRQVTKEQGKCTALRTQLDEAFRQISETGEAAQRQQGTVRLELEQKQAENARLQGELRAAVEAKQTAQMDLQATAVQLEQVNAQRQALAADIETARARDQDARGHVNAMNQKLAEMHAELEQSKLATAKLDADRVALTSQIEQVRTSAVAERDAQVRALRAELDKERKQMEVALQSAKAERDALMTKVPEQQRLSQELSRKASEVEDMRTKLKAAYAEVEGSRNQQRALVEREAQLKADLDFVKAAAAKSDQKFISSERALRKAKWEADTMSEERRLLLQELQKYKSERADIEVRRHAGQHTAGPPAGVGSRPH